VKGDDEDAVKEQERSQRLEENYRFKWNKNDDNDQRWNAVISTTCVCWELQRNQTITTWTL